jgi:hypothetical protein
MLVVIGLDYPDHWKWEDFDPSRLSSLMCSFHAPWWVAGGRALDFWMGRQTRAHQDVDVAVLRADQKQLHEAFGGWAGDGAYDRGAVGGGGGGGSLQLWQLPLLESATVPPGAVTNCQS